jgi:chromate transporter
MASVYSSQPTGAERPSLRVIVALFARDANLTFGGGSATAETLRREIVERRAWMPESDFRLAYAASRLTPATNLLALCTAVGWRLRGIPGALSALLAASIPSALVAAVVMVGYQRAARYGIGADALRGAVAVSVALLVSSAWALVKPHAVADKRLRAVSIVAASWWAHEMLGVSTLVVLIAAAALGAVWTGDSTP